MPFIGEKLQLIPAEGNKYNSRAVAILKGRKTVGCMPRERSRTIWYFLKRGGRGKCEVTGRRKKGDGLEVHCIYTFSGPEKLLKKLIVLLGDQGLKSHCCRTGTT